MVVAYSGEGLGCRGGSVEDVVGNVENVEEVVVEERKGDEDVILYVGNRDVNVKLNFQLLDANRTSASAAAEGANQRAPSDSLLASTRIWPTRLAARVDSGPSHEALALHVVHVVQCIAHSKPRGEFRGRESFFRP